MAEGPDWDRDGRNWPNREASRFVRAGGLRWHVQVMGQGPVLLLIHGTGAATHSWRALAPLLARHFTVVAPDLPGHGFTEAPSGPGLSLPGMAEATGALLQGLRLTPVLAAGHSAGVAILLRMCLYRTIAPAGVLGFNAALLPLGGPASRILSPLAKLLTVMPLVPRIFAWRAADRAVVERLIRDTGSTIDPAGVALYAMLMRRPGHAASALGMMARWDLHDLAGEMPRLATPLVLVVGGNDRAIPPDDAARVARRVPGTEVVTWPGLGHLAHEERPQAAEEVILRLARRTGVLPPPQ